MTAVPPPPVVGPRPAPSRSSALALSTVGLGLVGLPSVVSVPTLCPVRLCTGHACPGCGMTRAIAAGLRGEFGESWQFHPLAGLVFAGFAMWALSAITGRRLASVRPWVATLLWQLASVVFVAVWLLRWATGGLDLVLS